ncbi:MAG: class I SAM-dependent methyltransferase [Anaerolineales bacterium]
MPLSIPSTIELKTIRSLASFAGKRVLEVGVGDGRLAWPFALEAAQWIGLDPDEEELGAGQKELKEKQGKEGKRGKVRLLVGDARALSFPAGYFDGAFFTWSLC